MVNVVMVVVMVMVVVAILVAVAVLVAASFHPVHSYAKQPVPLIAHTYAQSHTLTHRRIHTRTRSHPMLAVPAPSPLHLPPRRSIGWSSGYPVGVLCGCGSRGQLGRRGACGRKAW